MIGEYLAQQASQKVRQHEKMASADGQDPIDLWSATAAWSELLEGAGWTPTGVYDTCGPDCSIWTRPGEAGSAKSATAHEPGCLQYTTDTGWAPLHVWSDIAAEELGSRTLSKLQFVARTQFGGNTPEAMSRLGLASLEALQGAQEMDLLLQGLEWPPPARTARNRESDTEGSQLIPGQRTSPTSGPGSDGSSSSRSIFTDLQPFIDGTAEPEQPPTILTRGDGKALFYPGKLNGLFGEPESGKTWVALAAVAEVLNRGGSAAYLDIDGNGAGTIVGRLNALEAKWQQAYAEGRFIVATNVETKEELLLFVQAMVKFSGDLVIIDAIGDALPMYGAKSESNDDVTEFLGVMARMCNVGTSVVTIDHVTKNAETRGGYAIGAQAKKARMDGSYMSVSPKDGFAPGRGGSCFLNKAKDRSGLVAVAATPRPEELWGTFHLFPDAGWGVAAPDPHRVEAVSHHDAASLARESRMVALSRVLEARLTLPDDLIPITVTDLKQAKVGFDATRVKATLEELLEAGCVKMINGPRSVMWVSIKPYEGLDDALDGLETDSGLNRIEPD